jgi:ketopantoate reductase
MKHAFLGAGTVGGLVGAARAHEGDQVTLIVPRQTHAQHPRMLSLERPYDTIEAPVRIETELVEPGGAAESAGFSVLELSRTVPRTKYHG